jgi:hypothetical protein
VFLTITFRTAHCPWGKGFERERDRPRPQTAERLFDDFVQHLESETGSRIDFVVVDQLGKAGGRFHQHALLAGKSLKKYPRRDMEVWLRRKVGYSRALPFRQGAAQYISRYIGRNSATAEWRIRIGSEKKPLAAPRKGAVIVSSADLPKLLFRKGNACGERDEQECDTIVY